MTKKQQALHMFKVSFPYEVHKTLGESGMTKYRNYVVKQYGYIWDIQAQCWLYSKERDMNKALGYSIT